MADGLARDIGERVRFHRLATRRTQVVIAGLAGITVDYRYQIERGKKAPALKVLVALARALDLPVASLLDEPDRESARAARTSAGSALHRAMTLPVSDSDEPIPHQDLRAQINEAWRIWQHSPHRYSRVRDFLDELVVDAEEAFRAGAGERLDAHRAAADLYDLVRTVAKRSCRTDLATLAAERAFKAAEASGDPLRIGTAQWNSAHAALAGQHNELAEDIALTAAERLHEHPGAHAGAVYGSLLLVSAVAAARLRKHWRARDRIRVAAAVAEKTGERNTLWTAFGPTNVAMHAVTVESEAGEAAQAAPTRRKGRPRAFSLDRAPGCVLVGTSALVPAAP